MRALNNIIILEEVSEVRTLESGFVVTDKDTGEMRYQKGKVKTFGPVVESVKKGDTIYYDKHRGYETVIDGEKVIVIRETDGVVVVD